MKNRTEIKRIISSLHSGITDAEFERRKREVIEQLDGM